MKKILFLSGTRADYGKLKSLMKKVDEHQEMECHIFVTGMHMLSKYGSTYKEIEKDGFKKIYKYINQKEGYRMDAALSNTITGLSNFVEELKPNLIVIHGDRLEALAGAIVGAFNNIKVAHIEGGEVSGTIDESVRHAITKFSHIHLVCNEEAKKRIIQLGEKEKDIYIIGSPDIDIMKSKELPLIEDVKKYYEINFEKYGIFMYHSVTTQIDVLEKKIKEVVDSVLESEKNYIVIYPNNDEGSKIIQKELKRLESNEKFRLFPSLRFESFLTLLKNADFMIGNSSAGVRETGIYGIPAIDIGSRQSGRYDKSIENLIHTDENKVEILNALSKIDTKRIEVNNIFGEGSSDEEFMRVLLDKKIWNNDFQKFFIDLDY